MKQKIYFFLISVLFCFSSQAQEQQVRWAQKIIMSTDPWNGEYWSKKQVLGVPDVYPGYTSKENGLSWIPGYNTASLPEKLVSLTVGFYKPIIAEQMVVLEVANPGSVISITVQEQGGKSYSVYKANAGNLNEKYRVLSIPFKRSASPVIAATIVCDAAKVDGWNYIDAIGIASTKDPINLHINQAKDNELIGQVTPLSNAVNSNYKETYPIISSDGKTLYFARSGHPYTIGNVNNTDIWYSTWEHGQWSDAKNMGRPLNNAGNNFVTSIMPDVNTLLIANEYNEDGSSKGNGVSITHMLPNHVWALPKALEFESFVNLNQYASYFLASDGKTLLMSIQMQNSLGDLDIYVSFLKDNGVWTTPKNIGEDINTFQSDATPFLAADGKTMYFASNGHLGYGGYDLFVTKRLDDSWTRWSKPVNLGPNINTDAGQLGFSVPASGDLAYIYAWRNDQNQSDIFTVKLSPNIKPDPVVIVYGTVFNEKTGAPVGASISYDNLSSRKNVGVASSNPTTGSYRIVLPRGYTYGYSAEVPGYFAIHEHIEIPSDADYKEIQVDLKLVPIEKGQKVVMQNVFFYQSTSKLIETSYPELDNIVEILLANPKLKIELAGHTDAIGDPDKNYKLSLERVNVVKDYLISKGVSSNQLTVVAYGGTKPIAPNSTEENRKKNRRVEFTILDY
jgi:outer membrane protein OmpA-like peptidoglycan-associated protein